MGEVRHELIGELVGKGGSVRGREVCEGFGIFPRMSRNR